MSNTKKGIVITPLTENLIACKLMIKYILVFGLVSNILALTTSLYSMQVLDRVLSSYNLNTLLMLTIVIWLSLALLSLIQGARAFAMNRLGIWFEHKLGGTVFKNAIKASLESKNSANSEQLRDLQVIKNYLTSPGIISIMDLPWALIFIVVLFMLHPWIGMLTVFSGTIIIVLGFISDRSTKSLIENNNDNFRNSMRHVEQITRNAEIVEVMSLSDNLLASWKKLNDKVQHTHVLLVKKQAILGEIVKFIRTVLQISVTGLGAFLVIKGEFTSGAIIASSSLVGRALAPFEAVISSWKGFISCRQSFNRLNSSFLLESDDDKMSLPEPLGRLEVDNVYFSIPGSGINILKGVSFSLEPGESLAVIGASASGKTTLSKVIVGAFKASSGYVRIDGASIYDWKRSELGKYTGYLPQDVELFSASVRENIARMDNHADHMKIVEAAQIAGVHDMILGLPKAYDTQIGIGGSVLSGGQRQRVGLARTFYGNPKLLVLDEPNASLDIEGEKALAAALQIAKERKITTVVVSHKDSLLQLVDKILIMRGGSVVFFGTHAELQRKSAEIK